MKKTFTKEYILKNKGCYSTEQVENLKCIKNKVITLKQLFRDLPIKDFTWFLFKKCDLDLSQKRYFALHCAKEVESIYNEKYPDDNNVSECIKAIEECLKGNISTEELKGKRDAVAYATAYAVDDVADVVYAIYVVAVAYADAVYAAVDVVAAVAAVDTAAYRSSLWEFVKDLK